MKWTVLGLVVGLLAIGSPSHAQTPSSYQVKYYNVGASQPLQQSDAFPASAAVCNQTAASGGSTVNPKLVVWDDLANAGKVCVYTIPTSGALPSLPTPGSYEGTLTAINAAGSAESARAPFSRLASPSAPTGLRITQ